MMIEKKGGEITDLLRLVATGVAISIAGAVSSSACGGLQESGKSVPFRPPRWVFGVAWPLLYVSTGVAWRESGRRTGDDGRFFDALFAVLVGLLCAWLFMYSCFDQKRVSLAIILSAMLLSGVLGATRSKWAFPLTAWLGFASSISLYEQIHSSA